MDMIELILYAVPVGPVADAIDRYFVAVADHPTTAQSFPPHCTLTGFFHDLPESIPAYLTAAAGAALPADVEVVELHDAGDWIGLELKSPDLLAITADVAERSRSISTRTDDIRLKDWLHVSLAYGHDAAEHDRLARLASELVDPSADVDWELRLYSREGGSWTVHGSWPLSG